MFTTATGLLEADLATAIVSDPLTVASTACIGDVIALMCAESMSCDCISAIEATSSSPRFQVHQSSVLVLEEDQLIGILTEHDLVRLSASSQFAADLTIAKVLSSPVITLRLADFTDIFVPLNLFQRHSICHLPLVNDRGQVVGLLTFEGLQHLFFSFTLLHLPTAAEVMDTTLVQALATATLAELTQLMATDNVSCVVIVDTFGSSFMPMGLVTNKEIVQSLALALNFTTVPAQTIMQVAPVAVQPETSLWEVWQLMQKRQVNQGVVLSEQGELMGLVTPTALLNVLNPIALYRLAERLVQERMSATQSQIERDRLLNQISTQIRASLNLSEVLNAAVITVRAALKCDRLLVYQFQPDWNGVVVAESVGEGWVSSLHDAIDDPCFRDRVALLYQDGKTIAIDNVDTFGYPECYLHLLAQYQVKASLVVPILVSGQLWGLLIGHQCAHYRSWQETDLSLLDEIGVQLAIAIQQATAYQQAQAELAERQRMEAALSASEKRYRQIVETTLEGIWIIDTENYTSYVNPRMAEMLGYRIEEMLGRPLFDFMDEAGQIQAKLNLERRRQGIQEHHDFRFKTKIGQDVWTLIATNPLHDEAGNYIGSLAMLTDITDRKQAEIEKIQAEKLRLELNILENILDTILAGYWDADLVKDIHYISPGFKRMFGYEDHELPNSSETWKQLVFPEDFPKAAAAYQAHIDSHGEIPYQVELRYRHKNGNTVWIVCAGQVIKWDYEGNPLRLIGCHIDITNRKQTEAKLQQQADREHLSKVIAQRIRASLNLQEVLNTTVAEVHQVLHSDRVLVYRLLPNGEGEVVAESVSRDWRALAGQLFPEEIFPRENYSRYIQGRIFALTDRDEGSILPCLAEFLGSIQVRAKLAAPILQNEMLWGLLIVHQCDQPRPWQPWEIDLLQHLSGQLSIAIQQSQLYAQLQDNHQQLTYINAELLRATRLKDEFLANMSHELRTPLNAILGLSESLLDEVIGPLDARQKKAIATVERSGQHLLALINDILELSKIEAGKLELDISTVSIAQLCQSSLVFIKPQAFKKQIQLNVILPEDLGEMALDERRMRQVLINLLTNAVKFTGRAGRVTLEVHREPIEANLAERGPVLFSTAWPQSALRSNGSFLETAYYLCISVLDTGIGIAPADQAKLFRPFVQVDSSLNRQYEGTGLGLVLVQRIVELHGGDVSLCSEPGQGSCFTIRLPYTCEIKDSKSLSFPCYTQQAPTVQVLKTEKITSSEEVDASGNINAPLILLAEDNEANISTMSSYLKARGYRLLVAKNGEEAIALTQANHPTLILMDVQMPIMDGLEAIQQIRQEPHTAQIPIIALTALAMEGDRERCLKAGANDYLAKPVKLKHLVATIQQILEQEN